MSIPLVYDVGCLVFTEPVTRTLGITIKPLINRKYKLYFIVTTFTTFFKPTVLIRQEEGNILKIIFPQYLSETSKKLNVFLV